MLPLLQSRECWTTTTPGRASTRWRQKWSDSSEKKERWPQWSEKPSEYKSDDILIQKEWSSEGWPRRKWIYCYPIRHRRPRAALPGRILFSNCLSVVLFLILRMYCELNIWYFEEERRWSLAFDIFFRLHIQICSNCQKSPGAPCFPWMNKLRVGHCLLKTGGWSTCRRGSVFGRSEYNLLCVE